MGTSTKTLVRTSFVIRNRNNCRLYVKATCNNKNWWTTSVFRDARKFPTKAQAVNFFNKFIVLSEYAKYWHVMKIEETIIQVNTRKFTSVHG